MSAFRRLSRVICAAPRSGFKNEIRGTQVAPLHLDYMQIGSCTLKALLCFLMYISYIIHLVLGLDLSFTFHNLDHLARISKLGSYQSLFPVRLCGAGLEAVIAQSSGQRRGKR